MCKSLKILECVLFFSFFLPSPARSQLSYSVECGPQYNVILVDQYPDLLSSFYSHALGLNLGFSIRNQHNSAVSINFSYNDFKFKRDTWSSKYYKPRNSHLYDLSIQSKTFIIDGKFSPYFLIGPGIHFMNWADLEYDPSLSDAMEDVAPQGQSTSELLINLGLGFKFRLTTHLDLLLESYLVLSKSYYLLPFSMEVAYTL